MATKKDLQAEVKRLNAKYCKNTLNKLDISYAYGGYQVVLTGKRFKNNPRKWRKGSLGSACANVTYGHDTATKTLNDLYKNESKGWLRSNIRHYEKNKRNW